MGSRSSEGPSFKPLDRVHLRAKQSQSGVVMEVRKSRGGTPLYLVFFSAADQRYVAEPDLLSESQWLLGEQPVTCYNGLDDLRREILLSKLRSPHGESLYSLHGSRVEFHVYQFKPVLKFLHNPEHRLLIADEVGLGKTIEAGVIMTELQARLNLSRVLIVCPASLRAKWRDEMRSRFEEQFIEMDSQKVHHFLQEYRKYGDDMPLRGIASIETLRSQAILTQMAEDRVHFDLVVIDEAHHCRNPSTNTNDLANVLGENADAMLLLTATPLHLGNQDLFHLLQILSPGEFDDLALFEERLQPNRHINNASRLLQAGHQANALRELRRVEQTAEQSRYTHNPYYKEVQELLKQKGLDQEQVLRAQRMLLELNTLAHIFTRTRKREVVVDAPVREAKVLRFDFAPAERAFYAAVVRFVREHWLSSTQESSSVGFALVMRERQAASCIPAFREHYIEQMTRLYANAEDLDMAGGFVHDNEQPEHLLFPQKLQEAARQLVLAGKGTRRLDTKFDVFQKVIREVLAADPNAKVLVFSFFRKTLDYLHKRLQASGIGAALIHGDIAVPDRNSILERFRETDEKRVLLSSEVGAEGIDLQFCHVLFNYDLPWNPMKVEQRIGRVDRFGQLSRKVAIYSLVAKDTIEDRIYARLYERIRIFEESIGDLEAILGDVMRDLTQQVYRQELSAAQERSLTDRAAKTVLRKKQELEEFEKHKLEFMGQDAIFEQDIRSAIAGGRYISQPELLALVRTYLHQAFPRTRLELNEGDSTWALEPCAEFKEAFRSYVLSIGKENPAHLDFLTCLRSLKPIPLTFSDQTAFQRKLVEYVNMRHPLARAAEAYWRGMPRSDCPFLVVRIRAHCQYSGVFAFFLYALQTEAVCSQERVIPVVVSLNTMRTQPSLQCDFMRIILEGEEARTGDVAEWDEETYNKAQRVALNYMQRLRSEAHQEAESLNDVLVNARLVSLQRTYEAQGARLAKHLAVVSEPRIRRMRQAQLANLEAKFKADQARLAERRTVVTTFSLRLRGLFQLERVVCEGQRETARRKER